MLDPEVELLRRKVADIERSAAVDLAGVPSPPPLVDPTGASELVNLRSALVWHRPVLRVQDGVIDWGQDRTSPQLVALLTNHAPQLMPAIAAVGRIERAEDPSEVHLGSGWVISAEQDYEVVVTNAHVARMFAERSGSGFVFRRSSVDPNRVQSVGLAFPDSAIGVSHVITDVIWISDDEVLDVAFLRAKRGGDAHRDPILLASEPPTRGRRIAVVGHPAYDSRSRHAQLLNALFGPAWGDKRLAPGEITEIHEIGVGHDCSTLPGSSGSAVLDVETGKAVGLQYAGSLFGTNYAVPAAELARLMRERPWHGQAIRPARPAGGITAPAEPRATAATLGMNAPDGSLKITVPLEITVSLGTAGQAPPVIAEADRSPKEPPPERPSDDQPVAGTGLIDRSLLGPSGFDLGEDEYVTAVAKLGSENEPAADEPLPGLRWSFARFLAGRDFSRTTAELRDLGRRWLPLVASSTGKLVIDGENIPWEAPDAFDVARILRHPATTLRSVAIDRAAPWTNDRWQWPLRIAAFPDDFAALDLAKLATFWPSSSLTEARELSREYARVDVLVVGADVRGALQRVLALPYRVRVGYWFLLTSSDAKWRQLSGHFDALLAETRAGGASLLALPQAMSAVAALNGWVEQLSHNEPLDRALALAFPAESSLHILNRPLIARAALPSEAERLAPRLRDLPAPTPFSLPPEASNIGFSLPTAGSAASVGAALETNLNRIQFDHESWGATAISRLAAAERDARRWAALLELPRYLQGDVFRLVEGKAMPEVTKLVVGQTYRFEVFIGEEGMGSLQMHVPFPAERLDWKKQDSYTLQVIFAEPLQWAQPLQGTIRLPHRGRSTTAVFVFSPTLPGPFTGRVTVLHRGRVLQTALLETDVVATLTDEVPAPAMQLRPEMLVRQRLSTLDDRRAFDAAVVLNHSPSGKSVMMAASERGAYVTSLDGIAVQLQEINGLLNEVALDVNAHSGDLHRRENAELLVKLALQGCALHDGLVKDYIQRSSAAPALLGGDHLQIVSTRPDALVPLEFVYEYKPPADGAPVCVNAIEALRSGRCRPECVPTTSPAPHVCPLGFWGLRKVIERHVHEPTPGPVAAVLCEPDVGRDTLKLGGAVLLAASKQVSDRDHAKLQEEVRGVWKQTVEHVQTWTAWRQGVERSKPVLIVALPHAEGAGTEISLEISGDVLKGRYLDQSYVLTSPDQPPIALLLGCDTVNVAYTDAYARHIAVFRRAGAALVLGTVATVFGKHAATMAARLVHNLATAVQAKPERFGEVLRHAKREAIANSEMIALCLVAFGDADWKLEA